MARRQPKSDPSAMDVAPMTPLSTVFQDMARRLQTLDTPSLPGSASDPPSDKVLISLERLAALPPTADLEARRVRVQGALDLLPQIDTPQRRQFEREMEGLTQKLEWAQERDTLQATRPEGCFCLGRGGRGERYIPAPNGGEPFTSSWDEWCTCPEAEVNRLVARAAWDARRAVVDQRMLDRQFAQTTLPTRLMDTTFDSYPVSYETRSALAAARDWANDPDGHSWLLLWGPYSTGKTGLAVAAFRQRLQTTGAGLFLTVEHLLLTLKGTYGPNGEGSESKVIASIRQAPLLVLDDAGAERTTGWVQEKLFGIVNYRYDQQLPTIITSNLDPAALAQHLGERSMWRIREMCGEQYIVEVDGPNLRDSGRAS